MRGVKVFIAVQVAALFAFAGVVTYVWQGFETQRERDCAQALENRRADVANEIATWQDVQDIAFNDPEDAPYFDDLFARIRARDEAAPPPASCH